MSEYFIGLDIGTESIGWAVTDPEYNIQKRYGKALWGVRMFPEAQKAADRRIFRTARRRIERRTQRIEMLRQIFAKEIAKKDPAFFLRIDESKFLEEDKRLAEGGLPLGKYTLFADKDYCDRDYHKQYPTIYHLRKALIREDGPFDVRLVYLAVHHILKNRGHFLFDEVSLETVTFERCFDDLKSHLLDEYELPFDLSNPAEFRLTLMNRELGISAKKKLLKKHAGTGRADAQQNAICDLLAGGKAKLSDLYGREFDKEENISFSFRDDYESKEPVLSEILGEEMRLISGIKRVYDWSLLETIKSGCEFISESKVLTYDKHKQDLKELKKLFSANQALKNEMFREEKDKLDNYPAYSGHTKANYRCDYGKFSAFCRKKLKELEASLDEAGKQKAASILERLENEAFLRKQTDKDNGVLPHQVHEQELSLILEKAGAYLPFLKETDESGLTKAEQILAIFRFRIPYYVGPMNASSLHSWVVRTDEKIYPWNFDKVVNLEASAEKFITRMTAVCTYIGEPVLPKDSLLYTKFVALNMINKLRINGHDISVETKKRIYTECLTTKGKATRKTILDFLKAEGLMTKNDELSGIDETFKVQLTGYKVFENILARGDNTYMVEDIIKHCALFAEDKRLFEGWLKKEYGAQLTPEDLSYISRNRTRFSGWGNLSREFLTKIEHIDPKTGEVRSIIDQMWETNFNLMELLSDRFSYIESMEKYRAQKFGADKPTLESRLMEYYASPGIRRAIHQTMDLVSEIEGIMKCAPKRIFLEVTRSEGEKARTVSRKKQLDELYAHCKKEAPKVFEKLQSLEEPDLRSTRLYLYFTQMGKCMYSGESIDFERLHTDYDIDHIYPQKLVKDDSITNRVLVKRQLNAKKSDSYPIAPYIRESMKDFWKLLKEKKLISEEKYRRLTRNTSFTDMELSGFIARQLVETSQSCKIAAELLKERYPDGDRVVYVKAGNVSAFRQDQLILPDGTQLQAGQAKNIQAKQDPLFVKCREVNDFHHAKDAYLNIVVGNVYHMKFTRSPLNFIKSSQTYNLNRMFDYEVTRNGECAWKPGNDGSISAVRRMMRKNNILFTRFAHEVKGGFYKQTILKKGSGEAAIKTSDPRMTIEKFGGYTERAVAYFAFVEHGDKKRIRSFESIIILDKEKYENNKINYLKNTLNLVNPRILIDKIKIGSLISMDGFRMYISGKDGNRILYRNANQLIVSPDQVRYIKQLSKYLARSRTQKTDLQITVFDGISSEKNLELFYVLKEKLKMQPFREIRSKITKILINKQNEFEQLTMLNQCIILIQLLNLFSTTKDSSDLRIIGEEQRAGRIRITKNLQEKKYSSILLIHQSVTGVFEKEIDLLGDNL